jgi:hypothetical protein
MIKIKYDKNIDAFLKLVEAKNSDEYFKGFLRKARLFVAMWFLYCNLSACLVE